MDPKERPFHASFKPSWGPSATLVYSIPSNVGFSQSESTQKDPILSYRRSAIVSQGRDIRLARIAIASNVSPLCHVALLHQHMFIHSAGRFTNTYSTTYKHTSILGPRSTGGKGAVYAFQGFRGPSAAR